MYNKQKIFHVRIPQHTHIYRMNSTRFQAHLEFGSQVTLIKKLIPTNLTDSETKQHISLQRFS